jgi:hypothetical protein
VWALSPVPACNRVTRGSVEGLRRRASRRRASRRRAPSPPNRAPPATELLRMASDAHAFFSDGVWLLVGLVVQLPDGAIAGHEGGSRAPSLPPLHPQLLWRFGQGWSASIWTQPLATAVQDPTPPPSSHLREIQPLMGPTPRASGGNSRKELQESQFLQLSP